MKRCRPAMSAALAVLVGVLAMGPGVHAPTEAPITAEVHAAALFVAHATADPAYPGPNMGSPQAPVRTILNATASGGIAPYTFRWEFGDRSNATGWNATHVYVAAGMYIARLTVTDSVGEKATSTVRVGASSVDGVNWVSAEPTPALGTVPLSVAFAVTQMGNVPTSYNWSFGDGETSPASAPNHTYAKAGVYLAQVNVTESGGTKAFYRMTVVADGADRLDALGKVSVVGLCYADAWSRAYFYGTAAGGTSVYSYIWEFGEGEANSTVPNPTYSYKVGTFHTANLTVVDSAGAAATSSISVATFPPPCPPLAPPLWPVVIAVSAGAVAAVALGVLKGRKREGGAP